MKYTGSAYTLGKVLGDTLARAMIEADVKHVHSVERAGLAMIAAVQRAVLGDDAADAYEHELYASGVRDGGAARRAYAEAITAEA